MDLPEVAPLWDYQSASAPFLLFLSAFLRLRLAAPSLPWLSFSSACLSFFFAFLSFLAALRFLRFARRFSPSSST
jgi:hypothetical protein